MTGASKKIYVCHMDNEGWRPELYGKPCSQIFHAMVCGAFVSTIIGTIVKVDGYINALIYIDSQL